MRFIKSLVVFLTVSVLVSGCVLKRPHIIEYVAVEKSTLDKPIVVDIGDKMIYSAFQRSYVRKFYTPLKNAEIIAEEGLFTITTAMEFEAFKSEAPLYCSSKRHKVNKDEKPDLICLYDGDSDGKFESFKIGRSKSDMTWFVIEGEPIKFGEPDTRIRKKAKGVTITQALTLQGISKDSIKLRYSLIGLSFFESFEVPLVYNKVLTVQGVKFIIKSSTYSSLTVVVLDPFEQCDRCKRPKGR